VIGSLSLPRTFDFAHALAAFIEREHPIVHCWTCLARRLGVSEGKIRDAALQLVITGGQRLALRRRSCAGCERNDDLLVLEAHRPEGLRT